MSYFQPFIASAFSTYAVSRSAYAGRAEVASQDETQDANKAAVTESGRDAGKPRSESGDILDLTNVDQTGKIQDSPAEKAADGKADAPPRDPEAVADRNDVAEPRQQDDVKAEEEESETTELETAQSETEESALAVDLTPEEQEQDSRPVIRKSECMRPLIWPQREPSPRVGRAIRIKPARMVRSTRWAAKSELTPAKSQAIRRRPYKKCRRYIELRWPQPNRRARTTKSPPPPAKKRPKPAQSWLGRVVPMLKMPRGRREILLSRLPPPSGKMRKQPVLLHRPSSMPPPIPRLWQSPLLLSWPRPLPGIPPTKRRVRCPSTPLSLRNSRPLLDQLSDQGCFLAQTEHRFTASPPYNNVGVAHGCRSSQVGIFWTDDWRKSSRPI